MNLTRKPLGSQAPEDITPRTASEMEAAALDAWRNKRDSFMVTLFTGSRLVTVRCTGQWFDGLGGYGKFQWEELDYA